MSDAPDEIVKAELADAPTEPPQPPLSISHLLLWILGSAVVLGSYCWLNEPDGEGQRQLVYHLDQFARSLTLGGGVAALLIYARRLIMRDAPLPRQPGHWLLVVQGVHWPAYWLVLFAVYGARGLPHDELGPRESFQRYAVTTALYFLWGAGVYLVVFALLRDAKRWRMFFAISAVLPLLHALLWCCILNSPYLFTAERGFILLRLAVTLAFLGICVVRDRESGIHRDWMHAAGVGLYFLGSVLYLAIFLLLMFLPREP